MLTTEVIPICKEIKPYVLYLFYVQEGKMTWEKVLAAWRKGRCRKPQHQLKSVRIAYKKISKLQTVVGSPVKAIIWKWKERHFTIEMITVELPAWLLTEKRIIRGVVQESRRIKRQDPTVDEKSCWSSLTRIEFCCLEEKIQWSLELGTSWCGAFHKHTDNKTLKLGSEKENHAARMTQPTLRPEMERRGPWNHIWAMHVTSFSIFVKSWSCYDQK